MFAALIAWILPSFLSSFIYSRPADLQKGLAITPCLLAKIKSKEDLQYLIKVQSNKVYFFNSEFLKGKIGWR